MPFMNSIGTQVATQNNVNKPLVLNEGQMIHGRIRQLFPGQLAEVQISEQKMVAKLEVPMRAGDSYYFQVTSINPEVQLKIISGPTDSQANPGRQLQSLMQAMHLPKSPEMTTLLTFVLKNNIPMTRENLLQAVHLLQMTPSTNQHEALLSIRQMIEIKLPLTESLFRFLLGVATKEGLHSVVNAFKAALLKDSSVGSQTRASVIQVLNQIEKPFALATSHALLGQLLQVLVDNEQDAALRFSVLQLLKESTVLPSQTSLPNLSSTLASLFTKSSDRQSINHAGSLSARVENLVKFISEQPLLSIEQKGKLISVIHQAYDSNEWSPKVMQRFANALLQMIGENLSTNPIQFANQKSRDLMALFGDDERAVDTGKVASLLQNAERSNNVGIQKLVQLAETSVSNAIDGKVMKETIQTIFRSLGFNYEALLLGNEVQFDRLLQSLKPQLLTIINDPNVTNTVRKFAEQLVFRMNGPALASVEQGVNHQLIMQLPLVFFGKKIDATLQWNGRMRDNEKIDADFARILFYLNLHSLQKTVVDMQVQNRIVTVTVYNEDSTLPEIGQPLQERLRDGLESVGYQLSGVFFKSFIVDKKSSQPLKNVTAYDEGGVDFRV